MIFSLNAKQSDDLFRLLYVFSISDVGVVAAPSTIFISGGDDDSGFLFACGEKPDKTAKFKVKVEDLKTALGGHETKWVYQDESLEVTNGKKVFVPVRTLASESTTLRMTRVIQEIINGKRKPFTQACKTEDLYAAILFANHARKTKSATLSNTNGVVLNVQNGILSFSSTDSNRMSSFQLNHEKPEEFCRDLHLYEGTDQLLHALKNSGKGKHVVTHIVEDNGLTYLIVLIQGHGFFRFVYFALKKPTNQLNAYEFIPYPKKLEEYGWHLIIKREEALDALKEIKKHVGPDSVKLTYTDKKMHISALDKEKHNEKTWTIGCAPKRLGADGLRVILSLKYLQECVKAHGGPLIHCLLSASDPCFFFSKGGQEKTLIMPKLRLF